MVSAWRPFYLIVARYQELAIPLPKDIVVAREWTSSSKFLWLVHIFTLNLKSLGSALKEEYEPKDRPQAVEI